VQTADIFCIRVGGTCSSYCIQHLYSIHCSGAAVRRTLSASKHDLCLEIIFPVNFEGQVLAECQLKLVIPDTTKWPHPLFPDFSNELF
jgi:hypothetical protein